MQGRVVSGHKEVLGEVQALATANGALKVAPLSVSGAFHTPLMQPAQDKLKKVSAQCCPSCTACNASMWMQCIYDITAVLCKRLTLCNEKPKQCKESKVYRLFNAAIAASLTLSTRMLLSHSLCKQHNNVDAVVIHHCRS